MPFRVTGMQSPAMQQPEGSQMQQPQVEQASASGIMMGIPPQTMGNQMKLPSTSGMSQLPHQMKGELVFQYNCKSYFVCLS